MTTVAPTSTTSSAERQKSLKHWQRRALKAEHELEFLRAARQREVSSELNDFRKLATMRVALTEIEEALQWVKEQAL